MTNDRDKVWALAQRFVQKNQLDKAIKEYERFSTEAPDDLRAPVKLGDLYARLGRTREATQAYSRAAEAFAVQGALAKAVALYKQIHKLDATHIPASRQLVTLYIKLGLNSDALVQLGHLSSAYEAQGQLPQAEAVLAERIALEGPTPNNLMRRAELAHQQGDVARSHDALRQVIQAERSPLRPLEWVGFYQRAAELELPDAALHIELARFYLSQNDSAKALPRLQSAFRAQPENREVLTLLARVFEDVQDTERAIATLRELAVQERRAQNHAAWERTLSHILVLNPQDEEAREWLDTDKSRVVDISQQVLRAQSLPNMVAGAESAEEIPLFASDESDGSLPLETEVATYDLSSEEVTEQLLLEAISFQRVGLEDQALAQVTAILKQHPGHLEAQALLQKLESRKSALKIARAEAPVTQEETDASGLNLLASALLVEAGASSPSQHASIFEPDIGVEASLDTTLSALSPPPDLSRSSAAPEEDPDLEIAHFFLKQGLTQEARDELDSLLAKDPVHAGALMLRGMLDEASRGDEAQSTHVPSPVSPARAPNSAGSNEAQRNDALTHLHLGRACREMGALSDAIREFALARTSPEQALEAEILMGLCHAQGGQFEEAARVFAHALETCGTAPDVLLQLRLDVGQALLLGHLPRHAAQFLSRVVRDAPDLSGARQALNEAESLASESTDPKDQISEHYALAALLIDKPSLEAAALKAD